MEIQTYIAENIKTLRQAYQMNLSRLASRLDIKTNTLSQYEHGHRTPKIETLIKICKIFDITLDVLVLNEIEHKQIISIK